MHDIDRTLTELEFEADAVYDTDQSEYEDEYEDDDEFEDDDDEFEFDEPEYEYEYEYDGGPLSRDEELELAAELVEIGDDEELEQFLGKLFRKVGRGLRRVGRRARRTGRKLFKKGVLRRLRRTLKRVAKRAAPLASSALGGVFGGPAGAAVGGQLGGSIFELELDGLNPEQRELEVARKYVKFAADATSNAVRGSQTDANPERIVRASLERAAQRHAPGLLRPSSSMDAVERPGSREHRRSRARRSSGRWVRRGDKIILLGV